MSSPAPDASVLIRCPFCKTARAIAALFPPEHMLRCTSCERPFTVKDALPALAAVPALTPSKSTAPKNVGARPAAPPSLKKVLIGVGIFFTVMGGLIAGSLLMFVVIGVFVGGMLMAMYNVMNKAGFDRSGSSHSNDSFSASSPVGDTGAALPWSLSSTSVDGGGSSDSSDCKSNAGSSSDSSGSSDSGSSSGSDCGTSSGSSSSSCSSGGSSCGSSS